MREKWGMRNRGRGRGMGVEEWWRLGREEDEATDG